MKFSVTCPCSPRMELFVLGPNSYAEFVCHKCGKTYYAKSQREGIKVNPAKKAKTEHNCIAD